MIDLPALLARHNIPADALTWLGEGEDNTAYTTADLVIRVAKRDPDHDPDQVAATVRRDAEVLRAVAALLAAAEVRIAVPTPLVVDPDAGLLVYRKIPGLPLRWSGDDFGESAGVVGAMLSALHGAPVEELGALAGVDDDPPEVWLAEAVEDYRTASTVLTAPQRRVVETFLAEGPPPPGESVFSHNDLGAEHLVAENGLVIGVIDWTDAAVTDSARDFAKLYRDLGPRAHDAVLAHYSGPYGAADAERTRFFARCGLIEDAAYGLRTGADEYVRSAIAAFAHTFD